MFTASDVQILKKDTRNEQILRLLKFFNLIGGMSIVKYYLVFFPFVSQKLEDLIIMVKEKNKPTSSEIIDTVPTSHYKLSVTERASLVVYNKRFRSALC